jgi:CRP-like cAMP-binding protein
MIEDLRSSGLFKMDMDIYESSDLIKKDILYSEGKRPKFLFYLKSGKIKSFRLHEDGKEYITNLYSAGSFIGYLPLLENKSYEDTAMVLESAEVVSIPRDEYTTLVFNDLTIASKFIHLIAENVKEKEERLLNLAYGSLRKRVAKALLDIHAKFNKTGEKSTSLDISREDIAQYVGTASESLIRTLSDFKSEKLIEIKDGRIHIKDLEKLQHLLY